MRNRIILDDLERRLQQAKNGNDKAECFRLFGLELDKALSDVVKRHKGDQAPFECCNSAAFDLAFADFKGRFEGRFEGGEIGKEKLFKF